MPHLSLSLLGSFRAALDDRPITDFKSNKVRGLLAYLIVESDRPHSRETLAGLLWPDYPDRAALDNLRYTLSSLRQTIDDRSATPPFLIITRDELQFNPDSDYTLDVKSFQQAAVDQPWLPDQLRSAIELYRGRFLEGFSLDDSPAFEEWILLKQEKFERQVLSALHALTVYHLAQAEYSQAEIYAQRQIALAAWDEDAHQQLMRLLAMSGQRSLALAQYDVCRRALKQELDVEPARATTKLYEAIRDGSFESEADRSAQPIPIEVGQLTNAPLPLTSFIGRQHEVMEITQLLAPLPGETSAGSGASVRLLTLIGAGGCGKTRLANQVAHTFSATQHYRHGVWWIDLSRLSDPVTVPRSVAAVFDLRESSTTLLTTLIANYLHAKEVLLIFDNCEHLIEACAQLIDSLLSACPHLQIMATSREAIGLTGEIVYRVPPLPVPNIGHDTSPDGLMQSDAIRLFIDRALPVASQWQFEAHASTVASICTRLDGIPLAIELAAARLKLLSIDQIAARLTDRFQLLTGGSRTAVPRHQTLRATMNWSYSLLTDSERALFRRLSVFADSWTYEAAESIVEPNDILPHNVLDTLTHLVDKSLVVVMPQARAVRYRMLETIREYAREKLSEATEAEDAFQRHLKYLVNYTQQIAPQLCGAAQKFWLDQIEAEHDNLRAALAWSLEPDRVSTDNQELGLRLAVALAEFWDRRNYWKEGQGWLDRALKIQTPEPSLRAQVCYSISRLERLLGKTAIAVTHIEESLKLFQTIEDTPGIAGALFMRASLAEQRSDYAAAQADAEESLSLFQHIGDRHGAADVFHRLGHLSLNQFDARLARTYFGESCRLFQETGDMLWAGILTDDLARVAHQTGDYPLARTLGEAALAIENELGYKFGQAATLWLLGELAHLEQNYPQAKTFYEASLTLARELDSKSLIGGVLANVGYMAVWRNDCTRAQKLFREGLEIARGDDDDDSILTYLAGLASVAAISGQPAYAARLIGAVAPQLTRNSYIISPACRMEYEHTVTSVRAQLGDPTFSIALAAGQALALEQSVSHALENPQSQSTPGPDQQLAPTAHAP